MIPEKPKRPYKNFSDFRIYQHRGDQKKLQDINFYPCLFCEGYGKVRNIDDCDPIEGYKLAPWYKCSQCKGTGRSSRKEFRKAYYEVMQNYRYRRERWKIEEALRFLGRSKLTEEELRALQL